MEAFINRFNDLPHTIVGDCIDDKQGSKNKSFHFVKRSDTKLASVFLVIELFGRSDDR